MRRGERVQDHQPRPEKDENHTNEIHWEHLQTEEREHEADPTHGEAEPNPGMEEFVDQPNQTEDEQDVDDVWIGEM